MSGNSDDIETYTWDDTYAIALALKRLHPQVDLEQVSLNMVYEWTLALPGFVDEPELANDGILAAIFQEWFEEVNRV
jgi:FeS assembly protein IscX